MKMATIDPANLIQALARGIPFAERQRGDYAARLLGSVRAQPRAQIPDSDKPPELFPAAI